MSPLTKDHVRHIATLARLRLSEEEVEKYATELTAILQYVDALREVDTTGVEPTAQVTGLANTLREDSLHGGLPGGHTLLSTSPLPIVDQQIQTPSAH